MMEIDVNDAGNKSSIYWAFLPTTRIFTRRLGFAPITGLCTLPLGFSPEYFTRILSFAPTIGLCTRLLGSATDYWALHPTTGLCIRLLGFYPNTGVSPKLPNSCFCFHYAGPPSESGLEHMCVILFPPVCDDGSV